MNRLGYLFRITVAVYGIAMGMLILWQTCSFPSLTRVAQASEEYFCCVPFKVVGTPPTSGGIGGPCTLDGPYEEHCWNDPTIPDELEPRDREWKCVVDADKKCSDSVSCEGTVNAKCVSAGESPATCELADTYFEDGLRRHKWRCRHDKLCIHLQDALNNHTPATEGYECDCVPDYIGTYCVEPVNNGGTAIAVKKCTQNSTTCNP